MIVKRKRVRVFATGSAASGVPSAAGVQAIGPAAVGYSLMSKPVH